MRYYERPVRVLTLMSERVMRGRLFRFPFFLSLLAPESYLPLLLSFFPPHFSLGQDNNVRLLHSAPFHVRSPCTHGGGQGGKCIRQPCRSRLGASVQPIGS